MVHRAISAFTVMALMCVSSLARAQDDYSRQGCYLGAAGSVAFPLGAEDELGPGANVDESLGLHARAGCRAGLAGGELHFEWIEGFDAKVDGLGFQIDGWAVTADGKVYPLVALEHLLPALVRRLHPFVTLGFGYLTFDVPGDGWDFAARLGGGLDVYLTRNVAINVDATYVVPVSNNLENLDYLSVGWGLLFRF